MPACLPPRPLREKTGPITTHSHHRGQPQRTDDKASPRGGAELRRDRPGPQGQGEGEIQLWSAQRGPADAAKEHQVLARESLSPHPAGPWRLALEARGHKARAAGWGQPHGPQPRAPPKGRQGLTDLEAAPSERTPLRRSRGRVQLQDSPGTSGGRKGAERSRPETVLTETRLSETGTCGGEEPRPRGAWRPPARQAVSVLQVPAAGPSLSPKCVRTSPTGRPAPVMKHRGILGRKEASGMVTAQNTWSVASTRLPQPPARCPGWASTARAEAA